MLSFVILLIVCSIFETLAIPDKNTNILKLMKLSNFGLDFYENISNIGNNKYLEAECLSQLQAIKNGLRTKDLWSIQIIDAWGRIPSGILYEHLVEIGNVDECRDALLHTTKTDKNNIQGKYCLADISIGQILNATEIPRLQIGICIPAACRAEQLEKPLEELLAKILNSTATTMLNSVLIKDKSCLTAENPSFEPIDWVAIGVSALIVMFMIMSTLYDYLITHHGKPLHPLLGSFSVRANMNQLFHISTHVNVPHIIPCLNGMRCLSIIWVVFIHSNLMLNLAPNINNIDLTAWSRSPISLITQAGNAVVDTFLFLSGLLVVMVSYREMEKNKGRINVPQMLVHRYVRLTPVLALAILYRVSVSRYIGTDLFKPNLSQPCKEYWWATLLYVQNYFAANKMCIGHSWYLAVDMQFYVISPLVLFAIWKWKRKGLAGLAVIGLLLTACLFSIIVIYKISVFKILAFVRVANEEMHQVYFPTYTRTSPWIVGIVIGYYIYCRAGQRYKLSKAVIVIGWLSVLVLLCNVLFVLYPKKQLNATPLKPLEGAFYLSLARIAWPLALAWIVFACVNGYGGPINQFLSCSLWQPLAKLSYCLYIWHLDVVYINAGRIKTNSYFSDYDGILRFWGDFGISLLVALLMYLAIESPVLNINKFLFAKRKAKPHGTNGTVKPVTVSKQNVFDTYQ